MNKQRWSIIVTVKVIGMIGKGKKVYQQEYVKQYCHTNVTDYYTVDSGLSKEMIVIENNMSHRYDLNRVETIQLREHKQKGVQ